MSTVDVLKKSLVEELAKKDLDYGQVLAIANEIAKLDVENVRFSIDASHISRLGLELVSKQETAVAELIKNAYDADAVSVDLIFNETEVEGGTLDVIDTGLGMSRDQLLNGFMRISTQDKVKSPTSSLYERQRAGRKGIGRFAAQRLGRKLQIVTQLASEDHALGLEIDWNKFDSGKDLSSISNQLSVFPRQAKPGTTLRILDLRDAWSEAQIQRTFRFASELLQPFPLSKTASDGKTKDPGFKVTFFRAQQNDLVEVASEEQSILAHATAKLSGEVDENGVPYVTITSEKYKLKANKKPLEFEPKLKPRTGLKLHKYDLLKGVRFSANYFIADDLPQGTRSMVRDILSRHGGIRVYRNGFRVLPYGEIFDDWLGLQRSSALRELLPPHHNTNFIGFVEINDLSGQRFEETASREGLLENDAFLQLQDFVYRGVLAEVMEIAHHREKKVFSSDKASTKKEAKSNDKKSTQEKAAEVAEKLRSMASGTSEDHGARSSSSEETSGSDLDELASEIEEIGLESQEMLEEIGMLRVLASLGLTIGEFTHEVRHALAALTVAVGGMSDKVATEESLTPLKENLLLLQSYVRYFDNAVTQNAHRKLEAHELRDLVNDFEIVVRPTLQRQNIELTTHFTGYDLFTKPMHKSEWSSVFLNLFTNSIKAIHRAGTNGRISISAGVIDDRLFIDFADNGVGIPPENRDKIFDAFFTTSAPPSVLSNDTDKLIGTGLGLKIVRDILDGSNGEIELIEPPSGYSTCFHIEIPHATEEEIGDAKY